MSALKVFGISTLGLFALIGVIGVVKKSKHQTSISAPVAIVQEEKIEPVVIEKPKPPVQLEAPVREKKPLRDIVHVQKAAPLEESTILGVDRVNRLFAKDSTKLPFIETVTYKSRVPWLQGRPAWIADYASYYTTSRHFIARSLNDSRDYYTQKVSSGDTFNVFQKGKDLRFYLVVDLAKLNMHFYAYDADTNMRYLLKVYRVGCGKPDKDSPSGCLTPLGSFTLGDKVAIYKPGIEGFFKDQKIEMIQVFGTRWLPYKGEQDDSQAVIKGYGIHGVPWMHDDTTGALIEMRSAIGCYDSSGCIRLVQEDIEELFSVVITKPTTVQIVKNFQDAKLPGIEWVDDLVVSVNKEESK